GGRAVRCGAACVDPRSRGDRGAGVGRGSRRARPGLEGRILPGPAAARHPCRRSRGVTAAAAAPSTLDAREALERIRAAEQGSEGLNAFISLPDADALGDPRPGPLGGAPVAVKDNIATLGLPTTCGSRMLEGYRSPFEATAVRRLREAGGVIVG